MATSPQRKQFLRTRLQKESASTRATAALGQGWQLYQLALAQLKQPRATRQPMRSRTKTSSSVASHVSEGAWSRESIFASNQLCCAFAPRTSSGGHEVTCRAALTHGCWLGIECSSIRIRPKDSGILPGSALLDQLFYRAQGHRSAPKSIRARCCTRTYTAVGNIEHPGLDASTDTVLAHR